MSSLKTNTEQGYFMLHLVLWLPEEFELWDVQTCVHADSPVLEAGLTSTVWVSDGLSWVFVLQETTQTSIPLGSMLPTLESCLGARRMH
jgi:hypothetical protein